MTNMIKPAIIVIAYNREESLKRLLTSLNNAIYESDDITLIISIDKSVATIAFKNGIGIKKILTTYKGLKKI